jgi:beta-N-acetylhexosaminidase
VTTKQSAAAGRFKSADRPRGPLMFNVEGLELSSADRERLMHPLAGGVILFSRNYEAPAQLRSLTGAIRALRDPALLIGVDHEGGRVQRFREGFTTIPPMHSLGERWDRDAAAAADEATTIGATIARELGAQGIDFSFVPVLDLDYGASAVIGHRAFHRNPNAVAHLAAALCRGLRAGGMAAVGKHFPGHGGVAADSHAETPVDARPLAALEKDDLVPFGVLAQLGIEAMMPAHVIYPAIDPRPAGYSPLWLQEILRGRLGFGGLIFSDDLSMAGAELPGGILARADAASTAGCDMLLVCNDAAAVDELLSRWRPKPSSELVQRAAAMERKAAL